jgi:hypothetical protein
MDRMMTYSIENQERRRSQRIPQSVPLFVRCLDSPFTFGGNLNTVEVSSHGCVIHALRPFPRGTELRLDILHGNRTTTARVVHSDPIGTGMFLTTWTVALELDKPGNIWMVKSSSPDWAKTPEQQRNREKPFSGSDRATDQERRS